MNKCTQQARYHSFQLCKRFHLPDKVNSFFTFTYKRRPAAIINFHSQKCYEDIMLKVECLIYSSQQLSVSRSSRFRFNVVSAFSSQFVCGFGSGATCLLNRFVARSCELFNIENLPTFGRGETSVTFECQNSHMLA